MFTYLPYYVLLLQVQPRMAWVAVLAICQRINISLQFFSHVLKAACISTYHNDMPRSLSLEGFLMSGSIYF
jgi:hypothetical protein